MKTGVLVLSIFGFIWAAAALSGLNEPVWLFVIPFAISAGFYAWASLSAAPVRTPEAQRRIRRAAALWSAIEGVAIFAVVTVLRQLGADDALAVAIAVIVGLHFFALARAFPQPLYYGTGAALIVAGVAGLMVRADQRLALVGSLAALVLWTSAAIIIVRARRAAG